MKCLFVHDFRSYNIEGDIYTTNLSYEILKSRYVDTFGELYILNRSGNQVNGQSAKGLVKASGEGVHFINKVDIFTPLSFFKNFFYIRKTVINSVKNSDYIIIRLDSFMGLIAANYCRNNKKKYLIEVVGCVWDSFWNKGLSGKLFAYPLLKKMQSEIKKAPYVVYVTREFLQKRYPTNGQNTNISNVQLPELDENSLHRKLEKINSLKEDDMLSIVTVASVEVRYKGQDSVIKALKELKLFGNCRFKYHLIGGGNDSYLRSLVEKYQLQEQVVFHGSMNHETVMNFLEECDIYIQPSKQEGLPRALIEGMSKGLLCYGTRVAGIPELLDIKCIFSAKMNNYKEIAKLLSNVNRELLIEQANRNFSEAKKYEGNILENRRKSFFEAFKEQKIYDSSFTSFR